MVSATDTRSSFIGALNREAAAYPMNGNALNRRGIIVLVNPHCHEGLGLRRWMTIKDPVMRALGDGASTLMLERGVSVAATLEAMPNSLQQIFIVSAGGDGTINHLVNVLLELPDPHLREKCVIGAIGLGSSNDFLKPFSKRLNGVPVRVNVNGPIRRCDAGVAEYLDKNNEARRQYFMINASVGVTASANHSFNTPDRLLRVLKSTSTASAIFYTAVKSILKYKNVDLVLRWDGDEVALSTSNIHVLKIPYVSGSLRYDQPIAPDDGKLSVNICRDMSTSELLGVLYGLSRGKFPAGEKRMSRMVAALEIRSKEHFVFECDGETVMANDIRIAVVPRALNVLTQ